MIRLLLVIESTCNAFMLCKHARLCLQARLDMWQRLSPNARAQFIWPHPGLPRVDDESVYEVEGPPDGEPAVDTFCMVVLDVSEVEYISLKSNQRIRFLPQQGGWSEQLLNT
jgi:pyridoxamine 5'-phosphate oxidase